MMVKKTRRRATTRPAKTRVTVWRPSVPPGLFSRRERDSLIATARITNLFDRHGRLKRLDRLPPAIACTVQSVTRRRLPNGDRVIRVCLRNKLAALERLLLGRASGRQSSRCRDGSLTG